MLGKLSSALGTGSLLALQLALVPSASAQGKSPACNQARAIVEEAKAAWAGGQPDHANLLGKLATARDLCPADGEVWKYSYCSAKALGDEKKARIYRDRAVFNGVAKVECGGPESVAPEPLPSFVRKKFALLVGISKFVDGSIDLKYAAKDAEDLREVLLDPRYGNFLSEDVFLLTNEKATRANILKALNQIALRAQEDDLVLLFFSSHGSPRRDGQGFQGIGYIVAHDTKKDEIYLNSIEFEDLSKKVSLIAARRKVTLLDTCYSGQAPGLGTKALLLEGAGVGAKTANLFLSGEGSYVITSSHENEISYESETRQNGFFTYFLIEALRQGTEPPTIQQVFKHLSSKVVEAVAREKKASQRPRLLPEDGRGEVRIGVIARP